MAVGRILRFDEVRGYGFIAPSLGGEDVFVHANDFGEQRHQVQPGIQVEYEVEEGDRGLKVSTVRILDTPPVAVVRPITRQPGAEGRPKSATGDDDGMCDVLAPDELTVEVTNVLVREVPSLTGAQISQVTDRMVEYARAHGWVEV